MNRVRSQRDGYTIVETMIFLAVTGGLFVAAMLMISGQQAKTEFSQAVRDVQTQIQDVANDVSTGFYSNPGNIQCSSVGGFPDISASGTDTQGTNQDCVFIGRFLQFAPIIPPPTDPEQVFTYSVIGLRKNSSGNEVTTYAETKPTAIAPSTSHPGFPSDAIQKSKLEAGLKAFSVRYVQAGIPYDVAGFGFMSTLAKYTAGSLDSGSQSVNVIAVGTPAGPGSPAQDPVAFAENIDNLGGGAVTNPDGGIIVCFNSGASNQHANITIGVNGNVTTRVDIVAGVCT